MDEYRREELIRQVEAGTRRRTRMLQELGIARSTYYVWRKDYDEGGLAALVRNKPVARRVWNRLQGFEEARVLVVARAHPELSARLIAVKITDEEEFSVSESTVFQILKRENLITPRPLPEQPAGQEWRHKTTRPDEIWQCDATNIFVVGWGYYKLIPIEDDYSRKLITWDLKPDETALSISDIIEMGVEAARREGHLQEGQPMPQLYTDNGAGFISELLATQLAAHNIGHIFGTPYHPQGRGKIERVHRRIKEKVCLVVYCMPDALKEALGAVIREYNATPHEALENVSPDDVYAGRKEEVLARRREKKRLTLERRKRYNLGKGTTHNGPSNP